MEQLQKLDEELAQTVRCITVTPDGWLLTGWTKAEAALLLADLAEQIGQEVIDELLEGQE